MTQDLDLTAFLRAFQTLANSATQVAHETSPFAGPITDFLGVDPLTISIVTVEISEYRYADWNSALDALATQDEHATVLGVAGGENTLHATLSDLLEPTYQSYRAGHPEFLSVPTGPGENTPVLSHAVRLFHWRDAPLAVLQRRSHHPQGLERALFQVLSPVPGHGQQLLDELTATVDDHSFLRGRTFSLETAMEEGRMSYRFLPRPQVPAENVVLPDGVLDTIAHHVTGIAGAAVQLRAHGQHLKRGVLLYGPPGTGKTHTVKHLLAQTPEHTAILLRGMGLTRVSEAAELARRLQPSIIVLEDCDLVAEDRSFGDGTSPLLFEVLDAVDGLDADADVTFLLTTNRVEVLEEALAQRPGRVDLAVEIPLPDEAARRRLLELYRGDVQFSDMALDAAAAATAGQTASFSKELIRRAVLVAVLAGETPGDDHLMDVLDRQLEEVTTLRERMAEPDDDFGDDFPEEFDAVP